MTVPQTKVGAAPGPNGFRDLEFVQPTLEFWPLGRAESPRFVLENITHGLKDMLLLKV